LKLDDIVKAKALENKSIAGGDKKSLLAPVPKAITPIHTDKELAKTAGVSPKTIQYARIIQNEGTEEQKKQFETGHANIFYEQLTEEIIEFDESLNQDEEVGVRLVSYGQTIQFHISDLGYRNPYLIFFYGNLDDGSPIQLVQHVSQISFVLIAIKRKDPEKAKKPLGFRIE
jgi:hypothetical protein